MVMEGETIVYRLSLPPVVHPWNCIFSHCLIQSLILAGTKRRIVTSRTEYFFNNLSGSRKSAGVRLAEDGIVTYAKIKVCVWARIYRFISLPSPGVSKVKITQATHLFHLSVHPIHCIEPLPTHGFFIWQVERTRFLIFRIHELRHDQQCKSIFSKPRPIRRLSTIKTHSS